jgi:predicted RND superfamily exporter protein
MTKTSPETTAAAAGNTVGSIHDLDSGPSYDADEFLENNDGVVEKGVPVSSSTGDGERKAMEVVALQREASMWSDERGNLKAVNLLLRAPCKIFILIILFCLLLSFLLNILVFRQAENGNPFTPPSNEFDLYDVRSVQYDSLRLAKDEVGKGRKVVDMEGEVVLRQSETSAIAYWVFEGETPSGLFGTAESIQAMKDAYDIFYQDASFQDYCLLDYRTPLASNETEEEEQERQCSPPLTPLVMYYPSEWDEDKVAAVIDELKAPGNLEKFNNLALCIVQGLYCELVTDVSLQDKIWAGTLGKNISDITSKWDMKGDLVENYPQVTELASYLIQVDLFKGLVDFGFDKTFSVENPVSQYSRGIVFWGGPLEERTAGNEEEEEESEKSERDEIKQIVKANYLEGMNEQADVKTHDSVNSYYFMTAIIGDTIISIVTQDALLAIFSFIFVFFWIRVNTQSWFLAFVGLFEIFFSIPVAWFIFTVVFQIKYFATLNSLAIFVVAAIGADDIFIFMDAYKQSQYHPELLGDLATRMSWVYRRTGVAMAITSATTCAAFLCTLITPLPGVQSFGVFAAVVIFIDYVLVMSLFCTAVIIYHQRFESRSKFGCCCPCGVQSPTPTEKAKAVLEECGDDVVKRDRVSEFFRNKVAKFVEVPLHRAFFLVIFGVWMGIAVWQALQLEPTKENEQFLDENHPLQKSITILNEQFPTANDDIGLKVYYAWGVEEVSRDGVNRLLEPDYFGEPNFVQDFDFNEQCQTDLLNLCDDLKTNQEYRDLIKRRDGLGAVYCFVEELAAYNVKGDLSDCEYVKKGGYKNETWQVDPDDLASIIPGFMAQKSCFDDEGVETIGARYSTEIGWNGKEMKYAAIAAESNVLDPFGQDAESVTRNEYNQFLEIATEANRILTWSCSGNVVMTDLDEKFVFMNNQNIYVQSALQSSLLGVCIAFVVLLLSTHVFHLAFFASISIICVLISVVGVMVMLGWSLGSIESILIAIIAGFSVDYVVHLAHAYEIAKGDTYERITEAFGDLGISVFNGMITSVVASIPLFFCQLQFFAKFGTFLCLTIAFSWCFANFGFMSVLATLKIPLKEKGCRL